MEEEDLDCMIVGIKSKRTEPRQEMRQNSQGIQENIVRERTNGGLARSQTVGAPLFFPKVVITNEKGRMVQDERSVNSNGFFSGNTMCIMAHGAALSTKRKMILTEQIIKHGGKVIEPQDLAKSLRLNTNLKDQILIICSEEMTSQLRSKFSNTYQNCGNFRFVSAEWITSCLRERCLLSVESFELFPDEKPQTPPLLEERPKPVINIIPEEVEEPSEVLEAENNPELRDILPPRKRIQRFLGPESKRLYDYLYTEFSLGLSPSSMNEASLSTLPMEKEEEVSDISTPPSEEIDFQLIGAKDQFQLERSDSLAGTILEGINPSLIQRSESFDIREVKEYQPRKRYISERSKSRFVCVSGAQESNPNAFITDELEKLQKIYTNNKDKGRIIAYRRAISMIRSLQKKIESEKDVEELPTIGKKIKDKIKEILDTGKLRKAEVLQVIDAT
eukprot:TRINITY_DN923_c0_g5_i2.p1 TRINITY_DN923_c0_g5~~TRINITY_DN923_c0_g5_i2.p1  ORF type:complete len:447 (-),score=83.38 TRINITY_DN923_c0_g5_i2:796-2136(-)